MNVNYFALSELHDHCALFPGATRLTLFGTCPWLSYSAPLALAYYQGRRASRCSALAPGFHIPRLWRSHITRGGAPHVARGLPPAFIFRAFGARILPGGTRLRVYDHYHSRSNAVKSCSSCH